MELHSEKTAKWWNMWVERMAERICELARIIEEEKKKKKEKKK